MLERHVIPLKYSKAYIAVKLHNIKARSEYEKLLGTAIQNILACTALPTMAKIENTYCTLSQSSRKQFTIAYVHNPTHISQIIPLQINTIPMENLRWKIENSGITSAVYK